MNVIPIPIIGMNTNTKEITENERKYKRQKYRYYGEYFINLPVVGLPCFFGFLTSKTFARKKRTNFHYFIGFIECFYLNLQPILIAPFKELKLIEKIKIMKDKRDYKPNIYTQKEHKKDGARFYFSFKAEGMSLFYIPLSAEGMDGLKHEMGEIKNRVFLTLTDCYGNMYSISSEKVLNGIINVESID